MDLPPGSQVHKSGQGLLCMVVRSRARDSRLPIGVSQRCLDVLDVAAVLDAVVQRDDGVRDDDEEDLAPLRRALQPLVQTRIVGVAELQPLSRK